MTTTRPPATAEAETTTVAPPTGWSASGGDTVGSVVVTSPDPRPLVLSPDGTRLGTVHTLISDIDGGPWAWITVTGSTGLVVVPLASAVCEDGVVRVPFGAPTVVGAPHTYHPPWVRPSEWKQLFSWFGAYATLHCD